MHSKQRTPRTPLRSSHCVKPCTRRVRSSPPTKATWRRAPPREGLSSPRAACSPPIGCSSSSRSCRSQPALPPPQQSRPRSRSDSSRNLLCAHCDGVSRPQVYQPAGRTGPPRPPSRTIRAQRVQTVPYGVPNGPRSAEDTGSRGVVPKPHDVLEPTGAFAAPQSPSTFSNACAVRRPPRCRRHSIIASSRANKAEPRRAPTRPAACAAATPRVPRVPRTSALPQRTTRAPRSSVAHGTPRGSSE